MFIIICLLKDWLILLLSELVMYICFGYGCFCGYDENYLLVIYFLVKFN